VLHFCTTRRERRTGFGTIRPVLSSSSQLRGSRAFGLVGMLLSEFGDARELTNLLRRAITRDRRVTGFMSGTRILLSRAS
jgi:hypothetical protein